MGEPQFAIRDLGGERVLTVAGVEHRTRYSERLIRLLIDRKGLERAPLYFPFKETRGRHFLGPLMTHLRARGAGGLSVLEIGCSAGHITEYLDEQDVVGGVWTFDVDAAFAEITRLKVAELGLGKSAFRLSDAGTAPAVRGRRLHRCSPSVIDAARARPPPLRDEYCRVLRPGPHRGARRPIACSARDALHRAAGVQWLPARLAPATRALPGRRLRGVPFAEFDAAAWRDVVARDPGPPRGGGAQPT